MVQLTTKLYYKRSRHIYTGFWRRWQLFGKHNLFTVIHSIINMSLQIWQLFPHQLSTPWTILLLHPFNGLFSRTTCVSRYQKGITSLDLNEARDDGVLGCSGISWTICKQSAPRSRQITTPTPHQSMFTGRMLFLTPSQQWQSTEGQLSTPWSITK